jgi:hypothetical protein
MDSTRKLRCMKRRVGVRTSCHKWRSTSRHVLDAVIPCVQSNLPLSHPCLCLLVLAIYAMDGEEDWNAFLHDHPIFESPKNVAGTSASRAGKDELGQQALELSLNTLPEFTKEDPVNNILTPSGRRQVLVMKDSDVVLAAGSEIRMASLGDSKLAKSQRTYKVCMSS